MHRQRPTRPHPLYEKAPVPAATTGPTAQFSEYRKNVNLPDETRPLLTDDERAVLADYGHSGDNVYSNTPGSESLNHYLRNIEYYSHKNLGLDSLRRAHETMHYIFSRTPVMQKPIWVMRGIYNHPDASTLDRVLAALRLRMSTNRTIKLPGYTSTTTNHNHGVFIRPSNLRFLIRARHGIDMSPYSGFSSEEELLLPHNSRFKVRGVQSKGGIHTVVLDQLVNH